MTEEGKKYAAQGSPEVQLFLAVPEEGSISVVELKVITTYMYIYIYIWWDLLVMLLKKMFQILGFQKKLGESVDSFAWKYAKENRWVELEKKQVSRKVKQDSSEMV